MCHWCAIAHDLTLYGKGNSLILFGLFEKVSVGVKRHLNRAMTHPVLHPLGIDALFDPE